MSKKLDYLNAEYEKVKEIAGREKAGYDSYMNVFDDSDENIFLAPPYMLAMATTAYFFQETAGELYDSLGVADDKSPSGRVRSKFEKGAATVLKNAFAGPLFALTAVGSVLMGLCVAALETPIALPKAILEAPFIIRNRMYNKRIEKAKARQKELENEICKEVQNPTKDEDFEKQQARKPKVVKTPVLKNAKEETKTETK